MKVAFHDEGPYFIYEYVNQEGLERSRLTQSCFGKPMEEVLIKGDVSYIRHHYEQALEEKRAVEYSDIIVGSNGKLEARTELIPVFKGEDVTHVVAFTKVFARQQNVLNRQTDRLFYSFMDNAEEAFVIFDLDQRILTVNPAFYEMLGYDKNEIIKQKLSSLQGHEGDSINEYFLLLREGENIPRYSTTWYSKAGQPIYVSIAFTSILDDEGIPAGAVAIIQNLTEEKRTRDAFTATEQLYELIATHTQDLVELIQPDGTMTYVSPSHEAVLGYKPEEMAGDSIVNYVHPEDMRAIRAKFSNPTSSIENETFEYRIHTKTEGYLWAEANIKLVRDEGGSLHHFVSSSRDITKRKDAEEQLKVLAYTDELTGLTNRRVFKNILKKAVARVKRQPISKIGLLYLDGDHFKGINDAYGHLIGDQLLTKLANRLTSVVREEDLVSRIGGDEFAILLATIESPHEAIKVADRILEAMKTPFEIGDVRLTFSFSIGISVFPDEANNAEELLDRADRSLYAAKAQGKNEYVYSSWLDS